MRLPEMADEVLAMAARVSVLCGQLGPWPDSLRDAANAYLILREWEEQLREDALTA